MKRYIDKDILAAEIERRIKVSQDYAKCNLTESTRIGNQAQLLELNDILSFLNTLEVKEEILDKKDKTKLMQKCVHEAYQRGYDMGALQTTNKMNHNTKEVDLEKEMDFVKDAYYYFTSDERDNIMKVTRHFFELGLKAQK